MAKRRKRGKLRRAGVGALPVMAGLLMASGLVRLGDGTGSAIIREFGAIAATASTAPDELALEEPKSDIAVILEALKEREAELDAREARLVARTERLEEIEAKVRAQMAELEQAETDLADLLKLAESAADDDLTRLTTVYENMKPKDAAKVFSEMAPAFAAGFLGRMRPDSAAAVLAGLDPQTAYSISVMIAGRHAEIRTDAPPPARIEE